MVLFFDVTYIRFLFYSHPPCKDRGGVALKCADGPVFLIHVNSK
jgi:hypothetical protein